MPGWECSELASVGKFLAVYGSQGAPVKERAHFLKYITIATSLHYRLLFKVEKFDDIQINLFCVL